MPRVKIDTPGVTVELDANEVSVEDLRKQAMETFREAVEVDAKQSVGPAFGLSQDKRWTADHLNPNAASNYGFAPVNAASESGITSIPGVKPPTISEPGPGGSRPPADYDG